MTIELKRERINNYFKNGNNLQILFQKNCFGAIFEALGRKIEPHFVEQFVPLPEEKLNDIFILIDAVDDTDILSCYIKTGELEKLRKEGLIPGKVRGYGKILMDEDFDIYIKERYLRTHRTVPKEYANGIMLLPDSPHLPGHDPTNAIKVKFNNKKMHGEIIFNNLPDAFKQFYQVSPVDGYLVLYR
jgi:hypothetical protein